MRHDTVFVSKHSPWLRALITCAMLVLALLSSAGQADKQAMSAAFASIQAAATATPTPDPDLCALLRLALSGEGVGWTFSSSNPTQGCRVVNTGDGLPASTIELEITKYGSPDAARAQLKSMYDAATANGFGRWDPTTFFGDPGHGYIIVPINLNDPGGAFARGCYVVIATSLRYPAPIEPTQNLLIRVDAGLKAAPCGGGTPDRAPVDALRIIIPGESAPCPSVNERYKLRVFSGPVRGGDEIGKVPFFIKSSDGKKVGTIPPEGGTLYRYLTSNVPDEFLFLNSGYEITIPSELPKNDKDRWKITIELGPGEVYEVGPTGSIKIPCNPADPVKITSGTADALLVTTIAPPVHKIETDNAIISPVGGGGPLYSALRVNAQAAEFTINIEIDTRDPAKTGITLYAGSVLVTPKNSALAPVTLTAGQRVDVAPATISVPAAVVEVPGVANQSFPETRKAATGIFMDYWQTHGGLAQQGYPISGLIREKNDLNGKTYTVQYFERAVFEFHPEYATPNDVLLSQLGTFQYKRKYPGGAPNQRPNQANGRFFPETGHWVGGKFLEYWNNKGGLAQQGLPLSDEFTEVSETDGKQYTVQYFERAVFELHPEFAPPNDVLLSLLGAFTYKQKYQGGTGGPNPTPTAGPGGNPNCSLTTNIAAASNGGSIAGFSSDYGGGLMPKYMIDGNPETGWSTEPGKTTNQYIIVALPGGQTYSINKVRLNPFTPSRNYDDDSIKDFEVRVSTTDANPASFTTVYRGSVPKQNAFFDFTFSPVQAKYVMLFVVNNYGGNWVEAREFEVYQACGNTPPPPPPPGATPTTAAGGQCSGIPANINMTVSPTNCAKAGSNFVFEATGFNPGEAITAYVTGPDGRVYGGNLQIVADQNGAVRSPNAVTLTTETGSAPGIYSLTMEGLTSHKRAIGYIRLLAP